MHLYFVFLSADTMSFWILALSHQKQRAEVLFVALFDSTWALVSFLSEDGTSHTLMLRTWGSASAQPPHSFNTNRYWMLHCVPDTAAGSCSAVEEPDLKRSTLSPVVSPFCLMFNSSHIDHSKLKSILPFYPFQILFSICLFESL